MPLPFKPYERRSLTGLLDALKGGLDPQLAYGIYSDTMGSALDRLAQQRALQQQRRTSLQSNLASLAGLSTELSSAGAGPEAISSVASAYGPRVQAAMPGIIAGTYPGSGTLAEGPGGLDEEDSASILSAASTKVTAARAAGTPTDFQTVFWGTGEAPGISADLTAAGFVGEDFDQAKELIRAAWGRLGGTSETGPPPAAPKTYGGLRDTPQGNWTLDTLLEMLSLGSEPTFTYNTRARP